MDLWRLPLTPSGRTFLLTVAISHRDRDKHEAALCNRIADSCRTNVDALSLSLADWLGLCFEVDQWAMTYADSIDEKRTAAKFAAAVDAMLNNPPHERREVVAKPMLVKVATKQATLF